MTLTYTERLVVAELARDGASDETIARRLNITVGTIKGHMVKARESAGVPNRTALALWWVRSGQYEEPRRHANGQAVAP